MESPRQWRLHCDAAEVHTSLEGLSAIVGQERTRLVYHTHILRNSPCLSAHIIAVVIRRHDSPVELLEFSYGGKGLLSSRSSL